jgi:dTDP-4-dehydrorhamnose reductase
MAGHVIYEYLKGHGTYSITGLARSGGADGIVPFDARDTERVRATLQQIRPEIAINCVGCLIQACQDDPENAIAINASFPHALSRFARELDFKLIHISTDCVFSGNGGGYCEHDFRDGDTPYARTKALGELNNQRDLTIRTSIIGPEVKTNGSGLLDWFLRQSGTIRGFDRVYWSGVTTLELAKAIDWLIAEMPPTPVAGLVHLTTDPKISKYELLKLFQQTWATDVRIERDEQATHDKSLVNTRGDFSYRPPDYASMLRELKQWMDDRPALYGHYLA